MSRTHRFLTKVDLPPDLVVSITSLVNQIGSTATLVGEGNASGSKDQNSTADSSGLRENDDSFDLFFDPRTRDFYTITAESENEGNEQDEALLGNASQLAHSMAFNIDDPSPSQPSISTAGNYHHGTRSRVHFQRDQDRAEGDGRTGTHGEVPRRTTPPEWQQHEQGTWATANDIRTLAASIDQGHQRIISAIQSNNHSRGGGVDPRNGMANVDRSGVGTPSMRRARPAGSTGVRTRSPFENRLSDQIRKHMDTLSPSARAREYVISLAEFQAFNPRQGECCTRDNFRLNLEGTPGDDWNKSAARVFVNDFLRTHNEYPAGNRVVRLMVQKKTTSAIKSLIKYYRLKDVDTPLLEVTQKRRNRRERKRTLYHRRRDLTFFYPGLSSQREKLEQLGASGMSSDETSDGDGVRRYRILNPQWRSTAVSGWLRYFDALYNRARRERVFGNDRGAFPRDRKNARKESDSMKFVIGLPRNAYKEEWLNNQIDVDNVVQPGPNVTWAHEPAIIELVIGSQARRTTTTPAGSPVRRPNMTQADARSEA